MDKRHYAAIEVPTDVRDQLCELAEAEGRTPSGMIGKLISEYHWRKEVEAAKKAMREAPQEVWDEYIREFYEIDGAFSVGPKDGPSQARS